MVAADVDVFFASILLSLNFIWKTHATLYGMMSSRKKSNYPSDSHDEGGHFYKELIPF